MSPAIMTASTFWSRNHSSVCLKVRLLPQADIFSSAPTFVMWMSETTPKRTFGLPPALNPAAAKKRLPPNAPSTPAHPPIKKFLRVMFIAVILSPTPPRDG